MSGGRSGAVDHDLLADYLGGALAGTAEEETVARLVAADPAWQQAHSELAFGMNLVRGQLGSLADLPEDMPDDVTHRLLTALGSTERPDGVRTSHGVRTPVRSTGRAAANRRRRWQRTVAAVLAAVVVAGLAGWFTVDRMTDDAVTTADQAAGSAPSAQRVLPDPAGRQQLATGTEYTPSLLARPPARTGAPERRPSPGAAPGAEVGGGFHANGGSPLDRLTEPAALDTCLNEIALAQGPNEVIRVSLVDYGTFAGEPVLVVWFSTTDGSRWASVSGPECGVPGSGADTRYRTRVG